MSRLEQIDWEQKKRLRAARIAELRARMLVRMEEQKALMKRLGEHYNFDPATVSIDDQTGAIHEHPPGRG